MLSHMLLRSVTRTGSSVIHQPIAIPVRVCSEVANKTGEYKREVLNINEGPERDLQNFPRYTRPEFPGKVRLGFIPEEWFQFFYNKTGVTGPYVFGIGLTTYLVSKEIYVLEHEYYSGISLFIMALYAIKKFGPGVAKFLDKEVDTYENSLKDFRNNSLQAYKDGITEEEKAQWQAQGQSLLFEAKRENVLLQLEAAFRERQMMVYQEVKKRMDYQVEKNLAQRRLEHKHMVNWIVNSVIKSISPQQEKEALRKCIADLKSLSATAAV